MGGWRCPHCNGENVEGMAFCGWCGVAHHEDHAGHDEQRLVTALFADISGFTTLADTLDTEGLHDVISPVITVLAGIAEGYGGTLAKYAGDAVLVFFGAPVAQEDHAVRAALTALDMHQALADALPRLGPAAEGLELHIGINSGRVIAGMFGGDLRNDYSILGDAVNVAQRLESVAPPGETYVGEITKQLIENDFDLEELGPLTLKGKTKPVEGWRLVGRTTPHVVATTTTTALVGRDRELEIARSVIDGFTGSGVVFSVVAEAGGGKTRLTQEIRAHAERAEVRWLEARCISYGASVAYFPFLDLLRRTYGIAIEQDPVIAAEQLRVQLANSGHLQVAPYFARVLGLPTPSGVDDLSQLAPEAFRRELHEAFATWLRAQLQDRPVVLAIEDVHWADATSLELATRLTRLARHHPLILYATGRPESSESIEQFASQLDGDKHIRLELGPLERDATRALVASTLQGEPAEALVDIVVERTGGNPFFAQELTFSLQETGGVALVDDLWAPVPEWDSSALPPTIEGVLAGRIDMLPRPTAHVLQVASVIGKRVNPLLLEAVADDVVELSRQLDTLIEGGFIDRTIVDGDELLTFHHALVAEVAYSRLVRRQRRDLHRRVAEAAEAIYGTGDDVIDLLARHFYLAEAGVKAVDYLERAGKRSEVLYANREAMLHFDRAVQLARANQRVASRLPALTLHLAELEELTGNYDEAETLFSEVLSSTNDIRAWRGLAGTYRKKGDCDRALELLDKAFADGTENGDDVSSLWLERVWTLGVAGRFAEGVDAATAGLQAVPDHNRELRGQLLLQLGRTEISLGRLDYALTHALEARDIFTGLGNLKWLATAHRVLGHVYEQMGDHAEDAVNALARGLELAERTGSAEEEVACLINLGLVELKRGNIDHAIGCDRRAVAEAERVGLVAAQAVAHVNLAEKLAAAEEFEDAEAHLEQGMAIANEIGQTWAVADAQKTLAIIRLKQGFVEEAEAHAHESYRLFKEIGDDADADDALRVVRIEVEGSQED